MRGVGITLVVALLAVPGTAVGQTNPGDGSTSGGPVIAVSPGGLDFGLVGVGRTKDLTLTVRNAGGGLLQGKVAAEAPFSVEEPAYSLHSGQSQSITVRYRPTGPGTNQQPLLFTGGGTAKVPALGWARFPPSAPGKPRSISRHSRSFAEADSADFIVRYYSDETSYVLKPTLTEGGFQSICDRPLVLKLASQQPGRELAAVVLVHYPNAGDEEVIKRLWLADLEALGYRHVVFLRGQNSMKVKGLTILDEPEVSAQSTRN